MLPGIYSGCHVKSNSHTKQLDYDIEISIVIVTHRNHEQIT